MIHKIYREQWTKVNGWRVRVDFVPSGGDDTEYLNREVQIMSGVFADVAEQKNGFDKIVLGLCDASSCKFVINYSDAPSVMKLALDRVFSYDSTPQVTIRPRPNLFVIWSDRGTNGDTWSVEYIGGQKLTPEIEYSSIDDELEVTIETVCVQKLAADTLIDIEQIRGYHGFYLYEHLSATTTPSVGYNDYANLPQGGQFASYRVASTTNYAHAVFTTTAQIAMVKLARFFEPFSFIYNRLISFYTLQPNANYSNYASFINEISYRFFKQAQGVDNVGTVGDVLDISDVWVMLGEHSLSINSSFSLVGKWLSGFMSDDDNEKLTVKSKNYWELLRQICESFYIKATLRYAVSGNTLQPLFRFQHPRSSAYSISTINYDAGEGESAQWKRNNNLVSKSKYHQVAAKGDTQTTEFFTDSLSEAGFEIEGLFNIDVSSVFTPVTTRNATMPIMFQSSYLNTRGLYYKENPDPFGNDSFTLVSNRVGFKADTAGGFIMDDISKFNVEPYPVGGTINTKFIDYLASIKAVQKKSVGFKNSANIVIQEFGATSGQTTYDMQLTLDNELVSERLGNQLNITPHPAMNTFVRSTCFITDTSINWGAKDDSDTVSCTFTTGGV